MPYRNERKGRKSFIRQDGLSAVVACSARRGPASGSFIKYGLKPLALVAQDLIWDKTGVTLVELTNCVLENCSIGRRRLTNMSCLLYDARGLEGKETFGVQGSSLPVFTEAGLLPPGDYPLTLDQLLDSMLVARPGPDHPTWDAGWRRYLVDQLAVLVRQLWQVGIDEIFINGSFVEDKDHPGDIDGYFVCDWQDLATGRLQGRLNALDPHRVWTWDDADRRVHPASGKRKPPMWHAYRVELFPHVVGLPSSIPARAVNAQNFPAFFRVARSGEPKGIVRITR